MRSAIAMIELIFAMVIIAISVLSIPSMMAVSDQFSKRASIDEDVLKRMKAEITKIYSSRWDGNMNQPPFGPLRITSQADLNCSRQGGIYRVNPNSNVQCLTNSPAMSASPASNSGNINLANGIEQLHGASYTKTIDTNTHYDIPFSFDVSYVNSDLTSAMNAAGVAGATWKLGSGNNAGTQTHLKRVVVTSQSNDSDTVIVLTFFKSNVGMISE